MAVALLIAILSNDDEDDLTHGPASKGEVMFLVDNEVDFSVRVIMSYMIFSKAPLIVSSFFSCLSRATMKAWISVQSMLSSGIP